MLIAGCATTKPPVVAVAPPPAPVAVAKPVPAGPPPVQLTRRQQLANALTLLNRGEVATARVGIVAMLAERPDDRVAKDLLAQIDTDPKTLLGERSYPYQIRAHETLSSIAGRLLRDSYRFYALAKYNGIAVPANAEVGQTIQIPGVAPVRPIKPPVAAAPSVNAASAVAERPAAPRVDLASAAKYRRAGLAEMARGAIDKAVPLLERALSYNPSDTAIQGDLARARKVQQTVRQN